jgi:hypothetical protein
MIIAVTLVISFAERAELSVAAEYAKLVAGIRVIVAGE